MLFKFQEHICAQNSRLHQLTKFHFYAKISGHDRIHPTTRVAVHSITKEKIKKTSTVTFLVNMKLRNLLELSILCFNVREPRKRKNQCVSTNAR
jgi:hypothetical protein